MPENGEITTSIENNIGTIEFYHPKGNSLPGSLLRELAETIAEAGEDNTIHVIVLKSRGSRAFCAGASFDELIAIENDDEGKHFFMGFAGVLNAMRQCSKMVIVRVHGKMVGGGVGIAAAGDYVIGHKSADVKLSELALGIGPFVIGPAVKRKIGTSAFSTLCLDASSWKSAEWARDQGLFSSLCTTFEELDEEIARLSNQLSDYSPEAMRELKKIFWKNTGHWDSLLEERAEISGRLVLSEFARKSIKKIKNQ